MKMNNHTPKSFEWTDDRVKQFTQLYSGNFDSKLLENVNFRYSKYRGKKLEEKIEMFKIDVQNQKQ